MVVRGRRRESGASRRLLRQHGVPDHQRERRAGGRPHARRPCLRDPRLRVLRRADAERIRRRVGGSSRTGGGVPARDP